MSSSVFTEIPSSRPSGNDGDSNLVVVYSKNGISFDERAIENIMEEKSISSISVVRLTSPTPSMIDQEEAERLEELERFLETVTDREDSEVDRDTDNDSQSGGDELISEKDHVTGDDNDNTGGENNDDSTENEAEVPKIKKRPGRKPKPKKVKKRRKPKERPQIVGLRVEQFYVENSADVVVKNALKLAGLSTYKRTPETDAMLEIIKNDHNYTPYTSPEQMKAQKTAEKLAMERQMAQGRKFIVQSQGAVKILNAKKRVPGVPLSHVQTTALQSPRQPLQLPRQQLPKQQLNKQQLPKQQLPKPQLPKPQLAKQQLHKHLQQPSVGKQQQLTTAAPRPIRSSIKVITNAEDHIEDDDDVNSSATADEENVDTEDLSEQSDESRETDNDRDSDIDFKMNNSRNLNKRKRVKKLSRRPQTQSTRGQTMQAPKPVQPPSQPQFPQLKRRKEQTDSNVVAPAIGQIVQFNTKAPATVIPLGRGIQSTSFLKMRPTHKSLPKVHSLTAETSRLCTPSGASNMRRTPIVQVGNVVTASSGGFGSPSQSQDVKEIIINKNLSSPKGVFTNLNSLLADNNTMQTSSPSSRKQIQQITPLTPKSSLNALPSSAATSKGFMPIGVETAITHKLPAQIVIETHQSSSELAAENDKQLDLINSIVQDELLKSSLVEQPQSSADETIPKLAKMLESSAAGLDQGAEPNLETIRVSEANFNNNLTASAAADDIDIGSERLLDTADEDEITADFLQHVVGLIQEDKQFEAEVVKQVLASTETGGLDAIANSVPSTIFENPAQLSAVSQSESNTFPATMTTSSLTGLPMASSTPARIVTTLSLEARPDVKVVRGNGRVIYLPPIEAPTTRAKRRAQNFPVTSSNTSDISNTSLSESALESSQFISSSLDSDSFLPQVGIANKHTPHDSVSSVRRPRRTNQLNNSQANDADASESQEDDDDDPNKLWCICRQPHNNRFMICCDLCEDWYHGTCVSVTKAMGLEMEQKGIDWKCPKCVQKLEEKSQPRITDMLLPKQQTVDTAENVALSKPPNEIKILAVAQEVQSLNKPLTAAIPSSLVSGFGTSPLTKPPKRPLITKLQPKLHQQQLNFIKLGPNSALDTNCIVCKRPARINSVYCSDECIRKYAQNAIQAQTGTRGPEPSPQSTATQSPPNNASEAKKNKKKDLFEDVLRQADSLSKVERFNVFERKSGRAITGQMAPSAQQLKKWLHDNPSFEVVQPGSQQAIEIERRQGKRMLELFSPEIAPESSTLETKTQRSIETTIKINHLLLNAPNPVKKEIPFNKAPNNQRRSPVQAERSARQVQPEPIRLNVRRTLKEQLLARIKEAQATEMSIARTEWLTVAEAEHFVKRVESEMFHSFGRNVNAKYKAKYRSLMFNIKDRKNKTLFEKICAKQVDPKQLVRMTPAELASQELAKWREEENRHQLEMIKKSELDLLARSQNYVVKTHKGEEVFESKVDVTLPEEQLEQASNSKLHESSDGKKNSQSIELSTASDASGKEPDSERSVVKEKHHKSRERDHSRERERDKERDRDKRHKSHKRHHHNSNKRSRSRSSSQGRSHKRHSHEHDQKKEREQSTRDKPSSKERSDKVKSPVQKKPAEKKPVEKKSESSLVYSLVDRILESEKTVEQAANLPSKPLPSTHKPAPIAPTVKPRTEVRMPPLDKYARYVQTLPKPALWSGNVHMLDVTDFDVVIHPVHGNSSLLENVLPSNLDVIGRITRVNVWEYLKKIKKSPTKEIVIVSLFPANIKDTANFDSFFEYLDTRQRLGVLGTDTDQIRDFYIFPLSTKDPLPSVLHMSDTVPFYEDTKRPNTLLGILVRCLGKRSVNLSQTLPPSLSTAINHTAKILSKTRTRTTFTPPSSPKRKHSTHSTSSKDDEFDIDAIIKAPIAKLQKTNVPVDRIPGLDDPNAPYSPGGSSDDNELLPSATADDKDELERRVDEINKQIAAQRMEIAGLLNVEPSVLEKPTSSSNTLSNISISPNVTKILASLKESAVNNRKKIGPITSADDEYNPEDAINSNSSYELAMPSAESTTKKTSRLAQLSEAELLSMVPDNLVDIAPRTATRNDEPPPPGV